MDSSHNHFDAIKRLARRSRMVSHPELHRELQLTATDSEAALQELITIGVLRETKSAKGTTFYWLAADSVPENRD